MIKIVGRIVSSFVWLGMTAIVLLMFVFPIATALLFQLGIYPEQAGLVWIERLQHAQVFALRAFCWVWVFFVGGCFASFLNVVAWRVPRGRSINGSSHCPQCDVKLSFRNNLPVLGWLRNGGRCANCQQPIPIRYLLAEVVLGVIFVILFSCELVSGGATIPFREINIYSGIENTLFDPQWDLPIILGLHLTLVSVLFTIAIIATERFAAPRSLMLITVMIMLGLQCLTPSPGIVDFRLASLVSEPGYAASFVYLLESPLDFAIAVGCGIAAAFACYFATGFSNTSNRRHGEFAGLLLIGIGLGWQSVLSISILSLALQSGWLLVSGFRRPIGGRGGFNLLATLVHLCCWRLQTDCAYWVGPACDTSNLFFSMIYLVAFVTLVRFCQRFRPDEVNIAAN